MVVVSNKIKYAKLIEINQYLSFNILLNYYFWQIV